MLVGIVFRFAAELAASRYCGPRRLEVTADLRERGIARLEIGRSAVASPRRRRRQDGCGAHAHVNRLADSNRLARQQARGGFALRGRTDATETEALMDRELDREHKDRVRLLIETMQRAGRSERHIEKAVLKASRRTDDDVSSRPSRRLVRFGRPTGHTLR